MCGAGISDKEVQLLERPGMMRSTFPDLISEPKYPFSVIQALEIPGKIRFAKLAWSG